MKRLGKSSADKYTTQSNLGKNGAGRAHGSGPESTLEKGEREAGKTEEGSLFSKPSRDVNKTSTAEDRVHLST